jgi:hypothetical protein
MSELVQVAQFDLNGDYQETDDEIIVEGLIFKAGEYKDKNYSMTPAEILTAVEKFTGADVDDSHNERSIFKGKMGRVREVYSPDNGETLWGKVGIKKWVDNAMGDLKRTVSCTWDRTTKTLAGLALTTTPRIEEAVLYAAFIADQEGKQTEAVFEGRRNSANDHKTIQEIHDNCMSLGAKCSGDNAEYSSDKTPNDNKELNKTMSDENKTVDFKDSAEFQAMQTQFASQQAEIERLKADKRHALAESAVKDLKVAKKIVHAEEANLLAAFEKALEDDAKHPEKVTFGQGQEGTRFDVLKALYEVRPESMIFDETVANNGTALFSQPGNKKDEPNKDRITHLKSLTPMGRASMAQGN